MFRRRRGFGSTKGINVRRLFVCQIVAETLKLPPDDVGDDASSDSLEAWDSLGHLDVIQAIEAATGVKFSMTEIPELTSVEKIDAALRDKGWSE